MDNIGIAMAPQKSTLKVPKGEKQSGIIPIAVILLITIIAYSNSFKNGFVRWDDDEYVFDNKDIQQLDGKTIHKFFTSYYVKMYQPVAMISYALDYKIGKLKASTYHCTNFIFHSLNVLLVFYFILLLTKQIGIAVISALFFAIHPLHVESVAWISGRKDLLYSFFYLCSLISYIFHRHKKNSLRYYFLAILFFLLSLFSKSSAVTLPLILILIDYYLNRKLTLRNNLDKIPFLLLSLIFGILSLLSQRVIGNDLDYVTGYSIFDRFFLGAYSFTFYIIKSILPSSLSAMHPLPLKLDSALPIKYYISSFTFIIFLWLLIKAFKSKANEALKRDITFGLLFFLSTIFLVIFIPVGQAVVAERYTYIPYIGIFMILGRCYIHLKRSKFPRLACWYKAAIAVLAIFSAFTTYARNTVWKDSVTLFSDVIEKYPESGVAYNNRGNVLREQNDLTGAMDNYNRAIELNYKDAYINRGILRDKMNDYRNALEDFNKALGVEANKEKAYYNRGIAKLNNGDFKGAEEDFGKAIDHNPRYSSAYINRGVVRYEKLSDYEGAINDFDMAISLERATPETYYNRGNAKLLSGNFADALPDYDKALEIRPDYAEAYFNRGIAFLKLKNIDGACRSWNKALELGAKSATESIKMYCR